LVGAGIGRRSIPNAYPQATEFEACRINAESRIAATAIPNSVALSDSKCDSAPGPWRKAITDAKPVSTSNTNSSGNANLNSGARAITDRVADGSAGRRQIFPFGRDHSRVDPGIAFALESGAIVARCA